VPADTVIVTRDYVRPNCRRISRRKYASPASDDELLADRPPCTTSRRRVCEAFVNARQELSSSHRSGNKMELCTPYSIVQEQQAPSGKISYISKSKSTEPKGSSARLLAYPSLPLWPSQPCVVWCVWTDRSGYLDTILWKGIAYQSVNHVWEDHTLASYTKGGLPAGLYRERAANGSSQSRVQFGMIRRDW
jgi:hypothetical protein